MSTVKVYVTSYCPFCVSAKRLLSAMGVPFDVVDVGSDPQKRMWLVEQTGMRTVPQIFVGPESVGGYDELSALKKQGELRPLLDRHGVAYSG